MQLSDLRTRLRARIGNPSTTDVPDTPNLDQHLNDAYQEILDKYKFRSRRARARFTTVVGNDKYLTQGLTDVIYKMWDRTNGVQLEYIGKTKLSEQDYDIVPNALVQNGRPAKWTYIESYIQLLPPPDGVYDIEFVYKIVYTPLAAATDIPNIPVTWHRGIYILASKIYYEDEGNDVTKAAFHSNAFKDWAIDKPVEEHEQTEAIDSGVEVPTLRHGMFSTTRTPDGVWWDRTP